MIRTLEQVFAENLKRLRGLRTQAAIAEKASIPLRSYQHAESGIIPQQPNREAIARALGVPVNALFVDPELTGVTVQDALRILTEFVESARVIQQPSGIPDDIAGMLSGASPELLDDVRALLDGHAIGSEKSERRSAEVKERKKVSGGTD